MITRLFILCCFLFWPTVQDTNKKPPFQIFHGAPAAESQFLTLALEEDMSESALREEMTC